MILYSLILVVHVLVSFVLIGVILIQGGRGGLSEALGGTAAQSLFGGRAVTVLTRLTAFCAGMFVVTCLSLAYLSTVRGRSVIEQAPILNPADIPLAPSALPGLPAAPSSHTSEPSASTPTSSETSPPQSTP